MEIAALIVGNHNEVWILAGGGRFPLLCKSSVKGTFLRLIVLALNSNISALNL
jgi:hypothetical protein